jgi:hypothetical protein
VSRLVSQGEDRKLGLAERVSLRLHFAICKGCRNFDRQLRFLRLALRRLSRSEDEAGR